MAYDANWFKDNMQAVPCGDIGACSFCCLRNLDTLKFCCKICCSGDGIDSTVYWTMKNPEQAREALMGQPPLDMVDWFNRVSIECARDVSNSVLMCALDKDKQK